MAGGGPRLRVFAYKLCSLLLRLYLSGWTTQTRMKAEKNSGNRLQFHVSPNQSPSGLVKFRGRLVALAYARFMPGSATAYSVPSYHFRSQRLLPCRLRVEFHNQRTIASTHNNDRYPTWQQVMTPSLLFHKAVVSWIECLTPYSPVSVHSILHLGDICRNIGCNCVKFCTVV